MPRKSNTRAASGAGTIRQRPDGRWEARVTVGTDPGTGKPIRRSLYGNTQKEVLTAMRDVLKAVDDGLYIEPTRLTLAQWLDIWQSDYLLSQKYGTVKTYKAQITTHIKPALGAVKLSKLTPHLVQGFYNDLLANGRTVPKRDKHGKIKLRDTVDQRREQSHGHQDGRGRHARDDEAEAPQHAAEEKAPEVCRHLGK